MDRMPHLTIDRVLSNNLGQAIASAVGVQFSEKKPTVSGKIVWGEMAIRAQVVAPPIVEGGMAITFRPFKLAADRAASLAWASHRPRCKATGASSRGDEVG